MRLTGERHLIIDLPEKLDFDENYETTASHFAIVRQAARGQMRFKNLRFNNLRFISPSAALVLASEVDLWNQRLKRRLRADVDSWDENIKRLLCEMGYFELLQIERPQIEGASKNTSFLRFINGRIGFDDGGKLAQKLRIEIESLVGAAIHKLPLYHGLSEAITNVSHHAYEHGTPIRQWWVSGSYDRSEGRLTVSFYDHGRGIPDTLPGWHSFEIIKDFFSLWTDSEKIKAAMETGRTATGKSERGKGLRNFLDFLESYREGSLTIYSLCGMYRIDRTPDGERQTIQTTRRDFKNSINGTLIVWTVNLRHENHQYC